MLDRSKKNVENYQSENTPNTAHDFHDMILFKAGKGKNNPFIEADKSQKKRAGEILE